jgi:hypothetical protein
MQREVISRKPRRKLARVIGRAIVEVPARAKQFDRGNIRSRNFPHQSSGQFTVDEKVCGENSPHCHGLLARFII